ncbi:MAG: PKD domain-containing protein, partial [Bacteroidota bacterium]
MTSGQHFWDFGDGNTSQQVNPNHTYIDVGSFDVLHSITDADGCQDTLIELAYISVGVNTLGISAQDTSLCRRDSAHFQTNAGPNSNVFWDFGDGNTSSVHNPSHLYQAAGIYQVTATVTDSSSCSTNIGLTIEVFELPIVNFTVADTNLSCELPFTVQFQDLSSNADEWLWYFGDQAQSNLQHPTHTYTEADSFKVSLIATGPNGCQARRTIRDFIVTQPLEVGFDASVKGGCLPLEVGFQDTTHSIFPITHWEWDFGDGSNATGPNPIHTYQSTGRFDVRLIVENSEACRDTIVYPNYVSVGAPPQTAFEPDTNEVCALQEVQFNNLTTGADTYIWFFSDGDTAMSTHPVHGFAGLDSMDVVLIAFDRGCPDTLVKKDLINVLAPLPIIGISDKKICKAPQDVFFQNLSIGSDTWSWVLEDGHTTTDPAFVYSIVDDGYFQVGLTVSNLTTGCTVTAYDSLLVRPLEAGFTQDLTEACAPFRVRFTDTSAYANRWKWYFSNGDSSELANPVVRFDSIQSYDVTLVVNSPLGCKDTLTLTDHIQGLGAVAGFETATPNNGCLPLVVDFSDLSTSTSNVVAWEWDFGDGSTSTDQNPSHTYTTSGYFSVTLT